MGTGLNNVALPGNQAVNGKSKPQPAVFGETGLFDPLSFPLDSNKWRMKGQ
jgi:hypothetical protein